MPFSYNELFLNFLEFYGFRPIELHDNFRSIFKNQLKEINPGMSEKEVLKLTNLIFHLDGNQLTKKRQNFQELVKSSIISSADQKRIYLFNGRFVDNQLHYYVDENPHLGRACIMLFVNGINLVSIHSNNQAPLDIVHKQYLHRLNHQPSLFEQTLFNVLSAEGELYVGRIVKDLEHFNLLMEQPFFNFMPKQLESFIQQAESLSEEAGLQLSINLKERPKMTLAFKHVNLILNQLWSSLMISYALKTDQSFIDL